MSRRLASTDSTHHRTAFDRPFLILISQILIALYISCREDSKIGVYFTKTTYRDFNLLK